MDLFLAICQGIGLALAAGTLAGSPGRDGSLGLILVLAAVALGIAGFAVSLDEEDYSWWPGVPAGAAVAFLAHGVARTVAAGAQERAAAGVDGAGGSPAAISLTIALVALAMAALSTLLPPVALVLLAAFAWMALGQLRRSDRKYEGLRILR